MRWRERYLSIDPRTLGVVRIALGALLMFDVLRRFPDADLWYTNAGLLPNHRLLWQPESLTQFSYLYALFTAGQVRVAFALTLLINLCFLVGYRTRLMHVLSWLALLSVHTRASILVNGGDYAFAILVLWSAFLPLGARFSLDRAIAQARTGAEPLPEPKPEVSLAALALLLQLSVIYLFNAVQKTGETWREGSAVHYMLHQARIVTSLGLWVREHVPYGVLRALSYGTLLIEHALPLLILVPWFPWPRRIALLAIWLFHGSIAALSNLGVFSPTMMVFSLILISAEDWALLERRWKLHSKLSPRIVAWLARVTPQQTPQPSAATRRLREATVAALLVLAVSELANENRPLRKFLSHEQPSFVRGAIRYLRLNQGWGMFAPEAPKRDKWLVVDAVTSQGEHIDPLNEVGSVLVDPTRRTIPARLGQSWFFCDYSVRLPSTALLHDSLAEWIFQHHERTQRPEQRVARFEAYTIGHVSPKPGETEPTEVTPAVFLSRRAPPE
jgi:hypothetical protein